MKRDLSRKNEGLQYSPVRLRSAPPITQFIFRRSPPSSRCNIRPSVLVREEIRVAFRRFLRERDAQRSVRRESRPRRRQKCSAHINRPGVTQMRDDSQLPNYKGFRQTVATYSGQGPCLVPKGLLPGEISMAKQLCFLRGDDLEDNDDTA